MKKRIFAVAACVIILVLSIIPISARQTNNSFEQINGNDLIPDTFHNIEIYNETNNILYSENLGNAIQNDEFVFSQELISGYEYDKFIRDFGYGGYLRANTINIQSLQELAFGGTIVIEANWFKQNTSDTVYASIFEENGGFPQSVGVAEIAFTSDEAYIYDTAGTKHNLIPTYRELEETYIPDVLGFRFPIWYDNNNNLIIFDEAIKIILANNTAITNINERISFITTNTKRIELDNGSEPIIPPTDLYDANAQKDFYIRLKEKPYIFKGGTTTKTDTISSSEYLYYMPKNIFNGKNEIQFTVKNVCAQNSYWQLYMYFNTSVSNIQLKNIALNVSYITNTYTYETIDEVLVNTLIKTELEEATISYETISKYWTIENSNNAVYPDSTAIQKALRETVNDYEQTVENVINGQTYYSQLSGIFINYMTVKYDFELTYDDYDAPNNITDYTLSIRAITTPYSYITNNELEAFFNMNGNINFPNSWYYSFNDLQSPIPQFNLATFFDNSIGAFFDVELFGYFSIGDIVGVFVGITVVIAFLKIFAGG